MKKKGIIAIAVLAVLAVVAIVAVVVVLMISKGYRVIKVDSVEGEVTLERASEEKEIFEGLKAYRTSEGKIQLFRPLENIKRMNNSARRMCLPTIDEQDALEILKNIPEDIRKFRKFKNI